MESRQVTMARNTSQRFQTRTLHAPTKWGTKKNKKVKFRHEKSRSLVEQVNFSSEGCYASSSAHVCFFSRSSS